MRNIRLLIIIFGGGFAVANAVNAAPPKAPIGFCRLLADSDYKKNRNANVAPDYYQQPFRRLLKEYERDLHFSRDQLSRGDWAFDGGGGLGAAYLELADQMKVRAVVANVQDHFELAKEKLHQLRDHELVRVSPVDSSDPTSYIKLELDLGFSESSLSSLARALKLSWRAIEEAYPNSARNRDYLLRTGLSLVGTLRQLIGEGQFLFESGYAEEIAARYPNRFRLITDMWGAFSYSPARLLILEIYYRALAESGIARIYIPEITSSTVKVGEQRIELAHFLSHWRPDIFSVEKSGRSQVLVMTKLKGFADLRLPLVRKSYRMGSESFAYISIEAEYVGEEVTFIKAKRQRPR